jgi:hypothetical protein
MRAVAALTALAISIGTAGAAHADSSEPLYELVARRGALVGP